MSPTCVRSSACGPMSDFLGEGSLSDRIWARPAISVLGIDAPPVADAAHKLVPCARASISVRLAPGDDAQRAFLALNEHLHRHAPWNADVTVTLDHRGEPYRIDASGPAFDAFRRSCIDTWGRAPLEPGSGGSLPLVAALADAYPDMALLLTGVDDLREQSTLGKRKRPPWRAREVLRERGDPPRLPRGRGPLSWSLL